MPEQKGKFDGFPFAGLCALAVRVGRGARLPKALLCILPSRWDLSAVIARPAAFEKMAKGWRGRVRNLLQLATISPNPRIVLSKHFPVGAKLTMRMES